MILLIGFIIGTVLGLTGAGHWWEDTYGLPTWPVIGKLVVEPNIQHHRHPTWMVSMGTIINRNYHTVILALSVLALLWFFGYITWWISVIAILSSVGNETHAWTHGGGRNPIVRFLHETGLIITPHHHAKHHKHPHMSHYCTLTNIMNPILDRMGFWRGFEFLLGCVGIHPTRFTAARDFL